MSEILPRWLDADAAATYVCMERKKFMRAAREGRFPKPSYAISKRMPRWDREELDNHLGTNKKQTEMRDAVDAVVAQIKAKGAARREAQEKRRNLR